MFCLAIPVPMIAALNPTQISAPCLCCPTAMGMVYPGVSVKGGATLTEIRTHEMRWVGQSVVGNHKGEKAVVCYAARAEKVFLSVA